MGFRWHVLILAGLLLTGCEGIGYARTTAPTLFGMEAVRRDLTRAMADARGRLQAVYGTVRSKPTVLACATQACYERFGGGRQRALSFGGTVLLSPRGIGAPILAHEWSHAELAERLDLLTRWTAKVPVWFDEGLAVAVSSEPTHSEEVWQRVEALGLPRPALADLATKSGWGRAVVEYGDAALSLTSSDARPMVVYPLAGHEVRCWLAQTGTGGLMTLIERLRGGEPFDTAYRLAAG